MSRLLAIDSATEFCSVAYSDGAQMICRGAEIPRRHSQELLPYIDSVLNEAGVQLRNLDGIVVSQGPGSFTGVRIGASMAQGLAFSCELPLVQVSTLAALAQAAYRLEQTEFVAAAIDARMGEVYWGTYRLEDGLMVKVDDERVCPPHKVSLPNISSHWSSCGTGWETYSAELKKALREVTLKHCDEARLPHAQDMLTLGAAAFSRGELVAAEDLQPHYLRNKVTWQKLPGR